MRVAIIGAGVSGLVAAHLIRREHDVTVFEGSERIGGHTHTHDIQDGDTTLAVDSGFIVFNEDNYPLFTRLLDQLGVASQPTDMGFSVRDQRDGTEYAGRSLDHVFAQRINLLKPSFHRMVIDLLRFYRSAPRVLERRDDGETLGEFLERGRYGRRFAEQHILPMGAALWSCSEQQMLDFPMRFLVEFLNNHRMLHLKGRPRWRVVQGGSRRYVDALVAPFRDRIRVSTPVRSVRREQDRVRIRTAATVEDFDSVVLACHSDQALAMLADPSDAEREVLRAMPYSSNETVLHTDSTTLPRTRRLWSAWNYHVRRDRSRSASAAVTYHMNTLQSLAARRDYCVTLNDVDGIDHAKVLARMDYAHPQYTVEGVRARGRWSEISGPNQTWYCGAYWGWGFHEDGVRSAARVGQAFGQEL